MSVLIMESVALMETLSPILFFSSLLLLTPHPQPLFITPLAGFHRPPLLKRRRRSIFLARVPARGASADGVPHSCPRHCLPIITPWWITSILVFMWKARLMGRWTVGRRETSVFYVDWTTYCTETIRRHVFCIFHTCTWIPVRSLLTRRWLGCSFLAFFPFFPSLRPPEHGLATPLLFYILIYLSGPDKHKHLHPVSSSSGRLRCLDVFHFPACLPLLPTSYNRSMLYHNLLRLVPAWLLHLLAKTLSCQPAAEQVLWWMMFLNSVRINNLYFCVWV